MSLCVTISAKKLEVLQGVVHGVQILMVDIYDIVRTTFRTNPLYAELFNKSKGYLPTHHVFPPVRKISKVYPLCMLFIPTLFIRQPILMLARIRASIGRTFGGKNLHTYCALFVLVDHISYPNTDRIICLSL